VQKEVNKLWPTGRKSVI